MISLKKMFYINKGDIISIVGSGGKTSFLFKLANDLNKDYKVLVSTSTKIKKPFPNIYDFLYTNRDNYLNSKATESDKNGIAVISKKIIEKTNKLIGINDGDLGLLIPYFDIILLEADGSKELPIKGWEKYEPPVLKKTNKTIWSVSSKLYK